MDGKDYTDQEVQSRVRDAAKDAQLGLQKLQDALDALGLDTRGLSTEDKLAKKKTGTPTAQAKELSPQPAGVVDLQPVARGVDVAVRRARARLHEERDVFRVARDDGQFPVVHAASALLHEVSSGIRKQQVGSQHVLQRAVASATLDQQYTSAFCVIHGRVSGAPGGIKWPRSGRLAAAGVSLAAPPGGALGGSDSPRSARLAAACAPRAAPPGAMNRRNRHGQV